MSFEGFDKRDVIQAFEATGHKLVDQCGILLVEPLCHAVYLLHLGFAEQKVCLCAVKDDGVSHDDDHGF